MSVKVVIVHVIIVMVEMIINAPHVLNPNIYLIILVMVPVIINVLHVLQPTIWLMIIPVKIVTLHVMGVQQQDPITVIHAQLIIMTILKLV